MQLDYPRIYRLERVRQMIRLEVTIRVVQMRVVSHLSYLSSVVVTMILGYTTIYLDVLGTDSK